MNICVFDTETTSLDKPFCYNIGYLIMDSETFEISLRRSFVVEQIWHNLPLFSTAYYAEKRPLYVEAMRARRTIMDKFGYICQQMVRDFKAFDISLAFAFNSPFDEKVFNFNCDWFKCINPFDNISIRDIRGMAQKFIANDEYKAFCDEHSLYTESGNYSTSAESFYRYILNDENYTEEHTALEDAIIEADIIEYCLINGADIETVYPAKMTIKRETEKQLHIKTAEQTDYYFSYYSMRMNKERTEITLR